jgi:hypothetical protein
MPAQLRLVVATAVSWQQHLPSGGRSCHRWGTHTAACWQG